MSVLAWALPALPLLAGALLLLSGRRADRAAPAVGTGVATVLLGLAVAAAVTRPAVRFRLFPGWDAGLAVDGLSAVLVVTVAAVALAVLVHAAGEFAPDEARARFFGLMLVFTGAMLVTVTAADLAVLLMGWEVMGAMSYALIGFWWADPERVRSADVAFLTTRAGDLGLYIAAGCAAAGAHSLGLADLAGTAGPWRGLVAAGIVVAALGKSAQLPFSFWLSRAMSGPSPVSALLHSATMVAAGAYLLLRLQPLLAATGWAGPLVAWAGALTALLLGVVALAQRDLKQLLAASTCAQLGFMVLGAGVGAVAGGTAHLVAHAAVKSLLFLCAGAWLAALGTQDLGGLRGAGRRDRAVGVPFAAGALALAGIPPLSLWVTKDTVLAAAGEESLALYAVGLAAAVLSAAYSAKALIAVWRRGGGERGRAGRLAVVPLPVLAVAACTLGILGLPAVAGPWRQVLGVPDEPGPGAAGLAVSGVLAVATVLAAVALARRGTFTVPDQVPGLPDRGAGRTAGWALGWLRLEPMAGAVLVGPTLALARALARFDDRVVDRGVRAAAQAGRALSALTTRRAEIRLDGAVTAVGRAARGLAALARRPQTGQVHAYYAQAAVLLAALVVVAVLAGGR
ncbi:NADH-quinone oxidoreductase subunit 5 family protein [Spirillospora sp. NBC_01491]|uniref:NADH-quinone oxidoreductase subunit 5 family protein n=1 Tax=Spirillospora sp. NBC_01491 TaxID=2976007 RepID=UPI002E30F9EF|nr:proton-conducting transporter membrane subunit [Spirillospora sp. NBC_01491]